MLKRNVLYLPCFLILICFSHTGFCAQEEPLLTFVLAGQSNMVGKRCRRANLPAELKKPNQQALFFNARAGKWVPLEPGKTEPTGFGPEISFGAEMAKRLKAPVGLIKHSAGGTNLAMQWNPGQPKSLYGALKKKALAAQKTRPIRIVGMLWQQGGADAKSEKMAKAYSENLKRLALQARKDFANPQMVFVSGRIPPKSTKKKPHWKLVRDAQQNLKLPHYAWVDCDALTKQKDGVHYDAKGMVDLGKLFAEKVDVLLRASNPGLRK